MEMIAFWIVLGVFIVCGFQTLHTKIQNKYQLERDALKWERENTKLRAGDVAMCLTALAEMKSEFDDYKSRVDNIALKVGFKV